MDDSAAHTNRRPAAYIERLSDALYTRPGSFH
jgi:hypothetical protein